MRNGGLIIPTNWLESSYVVQTQPSLPFRIEKPQGKRLRLLIEISGFYLLREEALRGYCSMLKLPEVILQMCARKVLCM